jgi:hypothetical protein
MDYYLSKRWRLKFRRDPDAGRMFKQAVAILAERRRLAAKGGA